MSDIDADDQARSDAAGLTGTSPAGVTDGPADSPAEAPADGTAEAPADDAAEAPADGGLVVAVAGAAPVVTLHLDDHHLVLETDDGDAVGAWRDEEAALAFARTLVLAAPDVRVIVSTWPAAALGALAEHLRRAGWRLGLDWPPAVATAGTGPTHDPTTVLDALAAVGATTPDDGRPVDEGIQPTGRHHVWHDGDDAQVRRTGLEGQPLD